MPELPDVEVFRRYFEDHALQQEISQVEVHSPEMLQGINTSLLHRELTGTWFTETARHGKHLFTALSSGAWVVWHFGMSGYFKAFRSMDQEPPHDRVRIDFASGISLGYSCQRKLGEVSLTPSIAEYQQAKRLGPDPLSSPLDRDWFLQSLAKKRGSIKSALMDQTLLAGIGNIYSDEILFQASVYPGAKACELSRDSLSAIYEALQEVLQSAIEAGADLERMPAHFLLPRRNSQAACPRCGGKVEKKKFSGRSGFYCPSCQSP